MASNPRSPMPVEATWSSGEAPLVTGRNESFSVAERPVADPHANDDVLPDGRFVMLRQPGISLLSLIQNLQELARRLLKAAGNE